MADVIFSDLQTGCEVYAIMSRTLQLREMGQGIISTIIMR